MFLLKKIIAPLFYPLTISLLLMILGLLLLWFTKKQKIGKTFVSIGVLWITLLSYGLFSDGLLKPLERRYLPVMSNPEQSPINDYLKNHVKWVVVLGGGQNNHPQLPVTNQISSDSLVRLTEAVRIYRAIPGSKIILSGGAIFNTVPEAETLRKTAIIMNINPQDLVLEDKSMDTEEEVQYIQQMIGKDPFILVTSAFHMPRSMTLFQKQGLSPIPAPTGYLVKDRTAAKKPDDFYPSPAGLIKAQLAIHEYLGIIWSKLRGKL
jgi:uncharacterized SAM-binding protein YcdF (DUF218 family)